MEGQMDPVENQNGLTIELTTDIVCAYLNHNSVRQEDLTSLIGDVFSALNSLQNASAEEPQERQEPAVSVRKSVTSDYIVCLEDGKKFKSLKRHIRTDHNLSPEEYRAKWGLRPDYPMVAPSYAQARSDLARKMGLGRKAAAEDAGAGRVAAGRKSAGGAAAKRGRRKAAA
jgi:predicted transcriptional regulator